jgi:predicted amino acid racemase
MFLDPIRRRNPALIEAAIALHQQGRIPANSYLIDLDAARTNAGRLRQEADRLGLRIFAMTKQMGRNPDFCRAVSAGGIVEAVAVDMPCARATRRAGMQLGHLGHLVQVPRAEANAAAAMQPAYWTVFNEEKAAEAAAAAGRLGRRQNLLARLQAPGDIFYTGHEGGFAADDAVAVADRLNALPHGQLAGITTFPAMLFDPMTRRVMPTPNLRTLERAAGLLRRSGRSGLEINAPGTSSTATLAALASAGATQVEPGHGLTGTTPLHACEDLPETPAVVYLSEISHFAGGRAYCFGGGLYIDPVFPSYQPMAVVASEPTAAAGAKLAVELPAPEAIDYYGMIDVPPGRIVRPGDSVVLGFRPQIFVTRAFVVGISGIAAGAPEPQGICDALGGLAEWP